MFRYRRGVNRLVAGAGGLLLGDLVLGLTASSSIMLGCLWVCSIGWLRATLEYAAGGFGSSFQLALACLGAAASLPTLGVTLYLGWQAIRLPAALLVSAAR